MKHLILTSLIAAAVAGGAFAQDKPPPKNAGTAGGAVAGAATGALVAGPIGAVVGGVAGATVGHKTIDKKTAPHHRKHKTHPAPAAEKQP